MKPLTIVLCVLALLAAGGIGFYAGRSTAQSEIDRIATMQMQELCAQRADRVFQQRRRDRSMVTHSYTNHYDPEARTCFVLFQRSTGAVPIVQELDDAYEGKNYGALLATADENPKPALRILACRLTVPGEAPKTCAALNEWNAFVARYMGS
ncbi:MAG TPA: hypothetical protein VGG10_06940 [Rhizomicrobium sp.]|jgi:hypothetical protein